MTDVRPPDPRSTASFRLPRTLVACAVLATVVPGARLDAQLEAPTLRDRTASRRVAFYLENLHIRGARLDDAASERIFDSFLRALDPQKLYFLQSDIDEFRPERLLLDDKLRAGELDFAHTVFARFLTRLEESVARVEKALASELDFEADESIEADRKDAAWIRDAAEADELWRKRVKLLLLERMAGDEKVDEGRERVAKLYRDFLHRMKQTDNTELLEVFLTSATTTYDPHTTYLSPETLENFEISMRLELEGIGAVLTSDDGVVVATEIVPGGAAARDGRLRARDKIHAVAEGDEGEFVELFDTRLTEVVKKIRGKRGTIVRLRVEHPDTGAQEVIRLERAQVVLQDREAHGEIIEAGDALDGDGSAGGAGGAGGAAAAPLRIGVIDLPSFYMDLAAAGRGEEGFKSTTRDVERIIADFRAKQVDAVVIDLRMNGGGSLREAIDMTGLFIDRGPVVQIKRPGGVTDVQADEHDGMAWEGPLVVLTSRLSASASEIFAGAIRDYGRGLVVGDSTTHGKGSVQELLSLDRGGTPDGMELGAIKITISKFYRPSGESTQSRGVPPHVELPSLRSHYDIGESDLDYALEFDRVAATPVKKYEFVDERVVARVAGLSKKRRDASTDFARVRDEIGRFLKIKDRKTTPLQRSKFFEDYKRRQAAAAESAAAEGAALVGPGAAPVRVDPGAVSEPATADEPGSAPEADGAKDAGAAAKSGIRRDYYLNEVLAITRDYVSALHSS